VYTGSIPQNKHTEKEEKKRKKEKKFNNCSKVKQNTKQAFGLS